MSIIKNIISLAEEQNYFFIFFIILLGFGLLKLLLHLIIRNLFRLAQNTKNNFDNLLARGLKKIRWPFLLLLSLWPATKYLNLGQTVNQIFNILIIIAGTWTATQIVNGIIKEVISRQISKNQQAKPIISFLSITVKIIFGFIGLMLILSSLGINVTSLVAGLGVSSVVLVFALQNILIDLFSSLSIYLDRPFQVGDFINVGQENGWVKKIGIRSTRLESIDGQKIIISNRLLTTATVQNLETNTEQLIKFNLKLESKTSATQCRLALKLIKEAISSTDSTKLRQVNFTEFSGSALIYEASYWAQSPDYKRRLDIQQAVNFKIKRALEQAKINCL